MRQPASQTDGARRGERGAALATVLVMVAVMSMLAIAVTDAARFSIQRTSNQTQMDQTRWYLLGAESYAVSRINQALRLDQASSRDLAQWVGRTITLPLDEGAMQITIRDGSNCFNLNGLAQQAESGPLVASEDGETRFAQLLNLVGVPTGRALAASLADWIDADSLPSLSGAEDEAYGGSRAVYLPPNHLMGDVSELRSVKGFDSGAINRLASFACVRPVAAANAVSVNTLRTEQAPLLSAIFGTALPLVSAEAVIRERPPHGWVDLEHFFSDPRLSGITLSDESRAMFTIVSRWYVIGIRVQYQGAVETSVALIDAAGGRGRVVRRVFGANATDSLL